MLPSRLPLRLSVVIVLSLLAGLARSADATPDPEAELARAKALRSQAGMLRDTAEARFDDENAACFKRFLVNRCIDQAKQRRLADVRQARAMDLEADRIELADKNRRFDAHQAEREESAARDALERTRKEAEARRDYEARMKQFADKDADRVRREQEGHFQAIQAAEARSRKDAEDARRRAEDAAAASARADKARQDREHYAEEARKHAEKVAEKAAKKQAEAASGKPAPKPPAF